LIGSFPSAYLYTRLLGGGKDIRVVGSGNVGGMNAFRNVGAAAGVLTGLTDLGKGALAVWLAGRLYMGDPAVMGAAAVAAVVGHNWMPWLGLRGGKGIGASAGALSVLMPWAIAPAVVAYVVGLALLKDSYASVVLGFTALPVAMYVIGGGSPLHGLVGLGLAVAVIAKHWSELRGFIRGRREIT
jgi:glycerol-3-phosphate acyltransferase PlsY